MTRSEFSQLLAVLDRIARALELLEKAGIAVYPQS